MNNQRTTAGKGASASFSTPANNGNQNRRGSQEGTLFAGLTNQKRSNSDAAAKARRESFADQAPKAGFMGSLWNSFVRGT